MRPLRFAIFGLSITSSWGNGHAVTWRSLVRGLRQRGHLVDFYERNQPWYIANRDLAQPEDVRLTLYDRREEIEEDHLADVLGADVILFSSYVPENIALSRFILERAEGAVVGFYDIDTPLTLARLERGEFEYLTPELISAYDIYLSFAGGPILQRLEAEYGSPMARALYCSVDAGHYRPLPEEKPRWDLAYLGTYSPDRQPGLHRLLVEPARLLPEQRFVVAGPQYPEDLHWPGNVERIDHLPPSEHVPFYNRQRFTLNITRADMIRAGWSPSVRLFEAAACGTPIISDRWAGLDALFTPGSEILLPDDADEVTHLLRNMSEEERRAIGAAARERVLAEHTGERRAAGLEEDLAAAAVGAASRGRELRTASEAASAEMGEARLSGSAGR